MVLGSAPGADRGTPMTMLPSWLIVILLTVAFLASVELGRLIHRAVTGRWTTGDEAAGGPGYVAAAALGLLSLALSFTLALSLDRYEERRRMVVDEADAISTTWSLDGLFDQPYRGRLDTLLRAYVRERHALPSVGADTAALDAADRRAEALQRQIWQETAAALRSPGAAPLTPSVLTATSQMEDLTVARRAALDAVVPGPVVWTLVVVAVVAALGTGYVLAGPGPRHRLASTALFLAVALVTTLIFELDEPRTGLIVVPEAPMDHVANEILTAPPLGEAAAPQPAKSP
jgi:hypothetical protein